MLERTVDLTQKYLGANFVSAMTFKVSDKIVNSLSLGFCICQVGMGGLLCETGQDPVCEDPAQTSSK